MTTLTFLQDKRVPPLVQLYQQLHLVQNLTVLKLAVYITSREERYGPQQCSAEEFAGLLNSHDDELDVALLRAIEQKILRPSGSRYEIAWRTLL